MADRQTAVKSIVAAMKSISKIQGEQNKLKMLMFMNNQKVQNSLFNKIEEEKALAPMRLEQKRKEKAIPTMGYKDVLFENIKKKPSEQWEPWEKQFMDTYTGGGEQEVIDPNTGQIIYTRPRKSVFQPKGRTGEDTSFLGGGGQPSGQPAGQAQPLGRIRVKTKDGQMGTIESNEFDPNIYEKI